MRGGGTAGSSGAAGWREIAQRSRPNRIVKNPMSAVQNDMQIQPIRIVYSSNSSSSIGLNPLL